MFDLDLIKVNVSDGFWLIVERKDASKRRRPLNGFGLIFGSVW